MSRSADLTFISDHIHQMQSALNALDKAITGNDGHVHVSDQLERDSRSRPDCIEIRGVSAAAANTMLKLARQAGLNAEKTDRFADGYQGHGINLLAAGMSGKMLEDFNALVRQQVRDPATPAIAAIEAFDQSTRGISTEARAAAFNAFIKGIGGTQTKAEAVLASRVAGAGNQLG